MSPSRSCRVVALTALAFGCGSDGSGSGRVEVLDAPPQVGGKGKIRLRISDDKGDSVEGEIAVDVCE